MYGMNYWSRTCWGKRQRGHGICHHRYSWSSGSWWRDDERDWGTLRSHVHPDETLFVRLNDGVGTVDHSQEFNDRLNFNGVVLTKLDGDTRGGAALSIRPSRYKAIKFIGTGAKMEAIDMFHPGAYGGPYLGYRWRCSLVERTLKQFDEEEYRRRFRKNWIWFQRFL